MSVSDALFPICPYSSVSESVIPVVGTLMAKSRSREVTQVCTELFSQFVTAERLTEHAAKLTVLRTLGRIATKVDPHFRDTCELL